MKKIVLTYGGHEYSEGVMNFAKQLNNQNPLFLTGVFLPELVYANLWSDSSGMMMPAYFPLIDQEDEQVLGNMRRFQAACHEAGIECRVHKDYTDLPHAEIVKETRFADVMILSSEKFYQSFAADAINENLRDVLHNAECPVIVVPEKFDFPTKNILFYDGSASSVFAIKQFSYLFPEFAGNETMIVYSKEDNDDKMPHESYMRELGHKHFKNLQFVKLHLNSKKEVTEWIGAQEGVILAGGGFGRSGLSEVLRKSFMHDIITLRKFPAFVAHR